VNCVRAQTIRQSGLALLLVLLCMTLLFASLGIALNALNVARADAAIGEDDQHLMEALSAGERLAHRWLVIHADSIVLAPEGGSIPICDDVWATESGDGRLTIVLYDALGGIPHTLARRGALLRAALPPELSQIEIPLSAHRIGDVDDVIERLVLPPGVRRFPRMVLSDPTVWTDGSALANSMRVLELSAERPLAPALVEVISPHAYGRVNINTAPMRLVESSCMAIGKPTLIETIRERRAGKLFTGPEQIANASIEGLTLVSTSNTWNVHMTARWRGSTRSWWVVLTGNAYEYRIIQRHEAAR
jgi:hypothetical protein